MTPPLASAAISPVESPRPRDAVLALRIYPPRDASSERRSSIHPMSPHRAYALADLTAAGVGLATGMLATLASILTGVHAWAFAGLLGTMLLDLVTATDRARTNQDETYDPEIAFTGWKGKGRRLALVALAFFLDTVLIAMSKESGIGEEVFAYGWTTAAAIGWLLRVEALSVIDNVRRTEGKRVVAPGFTVAVNAVAGGSQPRGHDAPGEPRPPAP